MPILIGVIVLGFVIGAGLSLSGRHDAAVVALASRAPQRSETFVPVTPAPTEKPTLPPTAAPLATERATTVRATVRAAVLATPLPATPTATPVKAMPVPLRTSHRLAALPANAEKAATETSAAPPAPLEPRATAAPPAVETSEAAPTLRPATAAEATATPPVVAVAQGDSAFARLSAAVVRQYLESVKRGDQAAAFAVLASPPASEQGLAEYGVVDARTSVGRIDAHGAANDDAFVSVQMDTPNGPYFGQYTVHKSDTGAAVIVAHSIVKP